MFSTTISSSIRTAFSKPAFLAVQGQAASEPYLEVQRRKNQEETGRSRWAPAFASDNKIRGAAERRLDPNPLPLPLRPRHTGAAVILHQPGARRIEFLLPL